MGNLCVQCLDYVFGNYQEKPVANDAQVRKLAWVLREYDCLTVEEAKRLAAKDATLHRLLRECGLDMRETKGEAGG